MNFTTSTERDVNNPAHVAAVHRPSVMRRLRRRLIDFLVEQRLILGEDIVQILCREFCLPADPDVLRDIAEAAVEPLERRGLIERGDTSLEDEDDSTPDWRPPPSRTPFQAWQIHTLWLPRQDKLDMLERRTESLYEFADE